MNNSHVIRQQVFEMTFSSKDKCVALQDKVSRFFNNHLLEGMHRLFDRVIPEDRTIIVDRLSITLPQIPFEWNDAEFADAILLQLERELKLLLLRDNAAADEKKPGTAGTDLVSTSLRLLEYFLLRGMLPWWAGESLSHPAEVLELLLAKAPEQLKTLILSAGQRGYVRSRLVSQFSEIHVRGIISILEPADAAFIFDYHTRIVKVQHEKQVIKNEQTEFGKALWMFILTYLLVDRGSYFNRKDFVKSNIGSLSAHYNIGFSELLSLLADALDVRYRLGSATDSLQSIIFELAVEDSMAIDAAGTDARQEDPAAPDLLESKLSMLTYFLTFGSFPWWSSAIGREELSGVLSALISRVPKTIEGVIRRTGTQASARELMVKTFDERTIRQLVELIEPDNAAFIGNYVAEIKTVHTKKAFVKTGREEFTEAVWLFVLDFLLVDRGSVFNRQMFLESNIRRLAARFNIRYFDLVVFLVQSLSGARQENVRQFSLFQGIIALYKEGSNGATGERKPDDVILPQDERPDTSRLNNIKAKISLRNILHFWIRMGYLPWWAGNYAELSPPALFEILLGESPEEALTLLKYAGLQQQSRRRMVFQASSSALLKALGSSSAGQEGLAWFAHLESLLKGNKQIKIRDHSTPGHILLFAFWDALIGSDYIAFRPGQFVSSVISGLALWLGVTHEKLVASLLKAELPVTANEIAAAARKELSRQSTEAVRVVAADEDPVSARREELPIVTEKEVQIPDWMRGPDVEKLIIRQLKERFSLKGAEGKFAAEKAAPARSEVLQEALFILRYYLRFNRLPEEYRIFAEPAVNYFLKELLVFLHREALNGLEDILRSEEYPGENFMRIHELFLPVGTAEENKVGKLLSAYLEKNMLLYVRQLRRSSGTKKNLAQLLNRYLNGPVSERSAGFLRSLLKFPSVSGQLAHYYHDDAVYRLLALQDGSVGWGKQMMPFLKSTQLWLAGLLPDRLDADRLQLLTRIFHFMLIGKAVVVSGEQEYLALFFRFVFERHYQLMLKIAAYAQKEFQKKKQEKPAEFTAAPELRQELSRYMAQGKFNEGLNKLLLSADKQALIDLGSSVIKQQENELKQLKKELEEDKREAEPEKERTELEKEAIYINNAGLVLLHPFLPVYFNRLEMIDKGDFVSEAARHRAVHLLQYLAYGTSDNEEHELVLNKILCNIPFEEAIPAGIELTEKERTVSAELLQAVIANWDKLKNTSAESLQASFLQRQGSLTKAEEGWSLKVEQRGYDVLLQSLPWGLGMIKTTWMSGFIYVEWS